MQEIKIEKAKRIRYITVLAIGRLAAFSSITSGSTFTKTRQQPVIRTIEIMNGINIIEINSRSGILNFE